MPDSLETIVYGVGSGLVSPGVGFAELALGILVGLAFLWSAMKSVFAGHHDDQHHDRGYHA